MKPEEQIKARRSDIQDELCRIERELEVAREYPLGTKNADKIAMTNAAAVCRVKLSVLDWALGRV